MFGFGALFSSCMLFLCIQPPAAHRYPLMPARQNIPLMRIMQIVHQTMAAVAAHVLDVHTIWNLITHK
jgi:hypothetical protein